MSLDFELLKENIDEIRKSKLKYKNSILEILESLYMLKDELDEDDSVDVTFSEG